jgi:hypothetical protein
MADELARLLLGTGPGRDGTRPVMGGVLLTLDLTVGPTYGYNTVSVGSTIYTNVPLVGAAALATGPVLLAVTDAGPVVLGRLTVPI